MTDIKIEVLAEFLDVDSSDIENYSKDEYQYNNDYFFVLKPRERFDKCREYIADIILNDGWVFNLNISDYLIKNNNYTDTILNINTNGLSYYRQNDILKIMETGIKKGAFDIDKIVFTLRDRKEIGNLLATYDGEENSVSRDGITYYIYQI